MKILGFDVNEINCRYFSRGTQLKLFKEVYLDLLLPEKVLFPKYIKCGQKVLDLGCGAGRTTLHIHEVTTKVIGTDISEVMIETARGKYRDIDFRVMDASKIGFPDNTFDVLVFSYNGLCYLYPEAKRIAAIKEIGRVLKKDGIFIFSSFSRYFPFTLSSLINLIVTKIVMGFSTKYKIHLTRYGITVNYETSPNEEIDLFKSMGFELMEMVPMTEKISFWGYRPQVSTYYAFRNHN